MTFQDGVIFQRTETGSNEIRNGKVVLRHNERLVLVLIDGITSYAQLRTKMRGLVQERFDLALLGLQEKGLIVEILFPLIDQHKDAIAPEVLFLIYHVHLDALRDAENYLRPIWCTPKIGQVC